MSIEKKNVLKRSKLLSNTEDQANEGEDIFTSFEKIPKNYPDGKRFIYEIDGVKYFAVKVKGRVFKTAALSEV